MMELYHRLLLHNEKGELIEDTGKIKSHSYTIGFLKLLSALLSQISQSCLDVDNSNQVILLIHATKDINLWGRFNAGAGVDTYGIVVGTGTTAPTNTDYDLDTKIAHSAVGAAGCLNYQADTFVAPTVSGPNVDFDISRTFLNETGSTITVEEVGIIVRNADIGKYHLIMRNLSTKVVLDGYTLTVVYTQRTTA